MAGSESFFKVDRCFVGPNPYATDPVLKVLWDTTFLEQPELLNGVAPMTKASDSWLDPIAADETGTGDTNLAVATWLTNWSFRLLNARRGHLKAIGTQWEGGQVISWIGYHHARLTLETMVFAAKSLKAFANDPKWQGPFSQPSETLLKHCHAQHPDYQAKNVMEASDALDIPYLPVEALSKSWQYGWGCNSVVMLETGLAENSFLFQEAARHKPTTKNVLRSLGLPVGRERVVRESNELQSAIKFVGFPCVTKPIDGMQSRNVTVDINTPEELQEGFKLAKAYNGGPVIVEQMRHGDLHRLMVLRGEYFLTIRRTPASVTGDGVSTIAELLEQKEEARQADPLDSQYIGPVPIDDELRKTLSQANVTLDSTLPKGKSLRVRNLPRSTRGAELRDATDATHDDVKQMAISIAKAMRLPSVGIDYITSDISKPPTPSCGFLEVNSVPSLAIPLAAGISLERCVRALLGGHAARIPATLTVLSADEMEAHEAQPPKDQGAGWVHGGACGIGSMTLSVLKATPFDCARAVLLNPLTKRIDITMATVDVLRFGLPLDRFDHITLSEKAGDMPEDWKAVLEKASAAPT